MDSQHYQIRNMTHDEVSLAIDWAASEGWNPGLQDQDSFFAADETGFLLGLLNGNPIACISAVKYEHDFGFIGFYLVKPEFRGHGYGLKIWQAAMNALAGRTVGLDGVLSQQDNYKKYGFQLAYPNIRYQGLSAVSSVPPSSAVVELQSRNEEEINQFDRHIFSKARRVFLANWLRQPGSTALAYLEDDRLAGYGVARPCRVGYKIGPLFAKTPEQAEQLFLSLISSLPHRTSYFLDIPSINSHAVDLVNRHAMQPVFETARMYLGQAPAVPIEYVYGVTSFELG